MNKIVFLEYGYHLLQGGLLRELIKLVRRIKMSLIESL